MSNRRTKFYLDKRNAKWLGVCAGIADYTGFDVFLVRLAFVVITIFGHFITIPAYLITAWVANDRPREFDYADREDEKFWQHVRVRPGGTIRDVRSRFRDIDRRLSDLEVYYTSGGNSRLANEIDSLR